MADITALALLHIITTRVQLSEHDARCTQIYQYVHIYLLTYSMV